MNRNKMAMALCIALLVSGICTAVLARQISGRKKTAQVENSYVALAKPVVGGTVIKLDDLKMIADLVGQAAARPSSTERDTGLPIAEKP